MSKKADFLVPDFFLPIRTV